MKSNNKKYNTTVGLIWVGCAILLFFAYMLVLEPQRQHRINLANRLVEQEKAYEAAVRADDEQVQAQLAEKVAGLRAKTEDFVVDFADSANLTFDISQTASRQQIDAFNIKSQDTRSLFDMSEFTAIDEHYFDVSLVTGFNQFAAFLNALERHEPTMLVDEFLITRSDDLEKGHQARLNLAVLVRKKQAD